MQRQTRVRRRSPPRGVNLVVSTPPQSRSHSQWSWTCSTDANPKYIVAYEVGFEGEINWDKPVVFNLAAIERIDKAEGGTARFFLSRSVTEPVEYVTRSSFDEVAERLGAIR